MGKASNFVSTDATKRRKQIAKCGKQIRITGIFFWLKNFFCMLTVEKHNIFNFWGLEKQNQFLNEVLHRIFRELL